MTDFLDIKLAHMAEDRAEFERAMEVRKWIEVIEVRDDRIASLKEEVKAYDGDLTRAVTKLAALAKERDELRRDAEGLLQVVEDTRKHRDELRELAEWAASIIRLRSEDEEQDEEGDAWQTRARSLNVLPKEADHGE